jgi:DNA-binding MarR family transcriptional regulator
VDEAHDILGTAMSWILRLHGVLDPVHAVPGLGASMSEIMALSRLTAGEVTQQDLGGYLGLEKSTVSRLLDGMTAKGWVDRRPDPANRRYRTVRLTPAGERTARQVAEAVRQRHDRILAALTPDERSAVTVALGALARAMAEEFGHPGRPGTDRISR